MRVLKLGEYPTPEDQAYALARFPNLRQLMHGDLEQIIFRRCDTSALEFSNIRTIEMVYLDDDRPKNTWEPMELYWATETIISRSIDIEIYDGFLDPEWCSPEGQLKILNVMWRLRQSFFAAEVQSLVIRTPITMSGALILIAGVENSRRLAKTLLCICGTHKQEIRDRLFATLGSFTKRIDIHTVPDAEDPTLTLKDLLEIDPTTLHGVLWIKFSCATYIAGEELQQSDGSRWESQPKHLSTSQPFRTLESITVRIPVTSEESPAYPHMCMSVVAERLLLLGGPQCSYDFIFYQSVSFDQLGHGRIQTTATLIRLSEAYTGMLRAEIRRQTKREAINGQVGWSKIDRTTGGQGTLGDEK